MKFPVVTVTLVAAALVVVLWDQTREQPEPIGPERFANLAANPVERSEVVDWVVAQLPQLCQQAAGEGGSEGQGADISDCLDSADRRSSSCRREAYDHFPAIISRQPVFRDLVITTMNCLVPREGPATS